MAIGSDKSTGIEDASGRGSEEEEVVEGRGLGWRLAILLSRLRLRVSKRLRMIAEVALCFRHYSEEAKMMFREE